MLKAIGAVLIIAVGTAIGFRASNRLCKRYQRLCDFCLFIGEISDKMRIGLELESIFQGERAKKLCICDGYIVRVRGEYLSGEEKRLLEEFFEGLGMSDTAAGISRCSAYRELLTAGAKEAEREMRSKSRLYGILGLFSGIFISILLI